MTAINLPKYNCQSAIGLDSNGSMLPRSFSPTKLSSAITKEIEIGKKPTTISKKGISRSPMISAPKRPTKLIARVAVKFIIAGKIKVNTAIGAMMRQSRNWSRTSRRVIVKAWRTLAHMANLRFLILHRLQINLFQAARYFFQTNNRETLGDQTLDHHRIVIFRLGAAEA